MSSASQQARELALDGRAKAVAGVSVSVFTVCMMLGLLISHMSEGSGKVQTPLSTLAPPVDGTATTEPAVQSAPDSTNWKLVAEASTDFQGNKVDRTVWDVYDGRGNANVGWRRPSALSVENNMLRIKAQGDVSGGLSQKFSQTYGRWVVRARMEAGKGYGPAILLWPDSEKWPVDGEIDFAEMPDPDRGAVIMTAHWGEDNLQVSKALRADFTQWHTFTVDWMPGYIAFYVDNVEQFRTTKPEAIPRKPMHLALQNDVGDCGSWLQCRDETTPETVSLWVSNVRVYSPEAWPNAQQ